MKNVIVIPIYKIQPDEYELISLEQAIKILSSYDFAIVCPKSLDTNYYENIYNLNHINYTVQRFDNKYFESISGYNQLMMSREFYLRFSKYEYMLIYQLDAYVFKDELNYWCSKGYDYIGAPWFVGFEDYNSKELLGVGNGGFSLRKTGSMLEVLKWKNYFKNRKSIKELYNEFVDRNRYLTMYKKMGSLKYFICQLIAFSYIKRHWQEDVFWSNYIPKIFHNFKIADVETAISFSFECQPTLLYEMNDKKLPFGCHAWWRYDLNFWKPFIESYGYKIKEDA